MFQRWGLGSSLTIKPAAVSCNGSERDGAHIGARFPLETPRTYPAATALHLPMQDCERTRYELAGTTSTPRTSRRIASSAAAHSPTQAASAANALPTGCAMYMPRIEVTISATPST